MSNKWYNEPNPNCDWDYEERRREYQHKRILKRRIRSACKILMGVSAFFVFGLVGSAELSTISIAEFVAYELVAIATFIVSLKIGATME